MDVILRYDFSSLLSSYFNYETVMWKSFMFFEWKLWSYSCSAFYITRLISVHYYLCFVPYCSVGLLYVGNEKSEAVWVASRHHQRCRRQGSEWFCICTYIHYSVLSEIRSENHYACKYILSYWISHAYSLTWILLVIWMCYV